MTTVNQYQFYCTTESTWKYVWSTSDNIPTKCPDDTGHTIDTNSMSIVNSVSQTDVTIHQPTSGSFMVETFTLNVPKSSRGQVFEKTIQFDKPVLLWTTDFSTLPSMFEDKFDVLFNPDTPVGALTSSGAIDDTTLNVSSTVTENVKPGMYINIIDNTQSPPLYQQIGKVLNVDSVNGTITLNSPLTSNFPAGSVLLLNIYMGKNIVIDSVGPFKLIDKGFQAKLIPENAVMTMRYTNVNGFEKNIHWRLGYYYGENYI